MATGANARLAEQQAALVRALVDQAPVPSGFDAQRVGATATALLHKRAGDAARHWPALFAAPDAHADFVRWAAGRARPTDHASFADGLAFAVHRQATGELGEQAASELARYTARRRGWFGRR